MHTKTFLEISKQNSVFSLVTARSASRRKAPGLNPLPIHLMFFASVLLL